jgi:glycosyltransferase involved in cell wall biosynthesis
MRILFASANFAERIVGGAQLSIKFVAEELLKAGHEVGVVFIDPNSCGRTDLENGLTVFCVPPKNVHWHLSSRKGTARRAIWHFIDRFGDTLDAEFNRILQEYRPEVIHTNVLGGLTTAMWRVAYRHKIPVVHTVHDYYLVCKNSGMRTQTGNCESQCRGCKVISRNSRHDTKYVTAVAYVSKHMRLVHESAGIFISANHITEEIIGAFKRSHSPTRPERGTILKIGFLGRVAPDKGLDRLISEVGAAKSQIRLLVGGEGEAGYIEMLRRLAKPGTVEFLGRVAPDTFLDSIDVLVVPSLWNEPAARVVYEAGLSNLPVVVTKRGGLPQLVEYGTRGWIYDPDLKGDLPRVINEMDLNWTLVQEKVFNWGTVAHEFSPEYVAKKTVDLYQRTITNQLQIK